MLRGVTVKQTQHGSKYYHLHMLLWNSFSRISIFRVGKSYISTDGNNYSVWGWRNLNDLWWLTRIDWNKQTNRGTTECISVCDERLCSNFSKGSPLLSSYCFAWPQFVRWHQSVKSLFIEMRSGLLPFGNITVSHSYSDCRLQRKNSFLFNSKFCALLRYPPSQTATLLEQLFPPKESCQWLCLRKLVTKSSLHAYHYTWVAEEKEVLLTVRLWKE